MSDTPDFEDCFEVDGHAHGIVLYEVDYAREEDGIRNPSDAVVLPALGLFKPSEHEGNLRFYPYAMCTSAHPLVSLSLWLTRKDTTNILRYYDHELREKKVAFNDVVKPLTWGGYFPEGIEVPTGCSYPVSLMDADKWSVVITNLRDQSDPYLGYVSDKDLMEDLLRNRPSQYGPAREPDYYNEHPSLAIKLAHVTAQAELWKQQKEQLEDLEKHTSRMALMTWPGSVHTAWYAAHVRRTAWLTWLAATNNLEDYFPFVQHEWEELPSVDEQGRWSNDGSLHACHAVAYTGCETCHRLYRLMRSASDSDWEPGELAAAMAPQHEATVTHSGPLREDLVIS